MQNKTFDWAQFELKKTDVIEAWLKKIYINPESHIIEIGAGKGIITKLLAKRFQAVQAIEIDETNLQHLRKLQADHKNLEILHTDFLQQNTSESNYHIVANPPFNISRKILDHIISQKNLPLSWHFMLQKETVLKIAKKDGEHNSLSAFIGTFYECSKTSDLKRDDFTPTAHVSISTISAYIKEIPIALVNSTERMDYMHFIESIFNKSNQPIKNRLKQHFSNTQIKRLCSTNKINPEGDPFLLSVSQWLALFLFKKSIKT